MLSGLLLGAQAAGVVMDYVGTQQQIEMGRVGAKLEQASIGANLSMTRLQAEQASTAAMENLRQTIGSQIAIFAARGVRSGAGSAATITANTVGNASADERTRRMNLLAKEAELRAGGVLSGLHQLTSETQLGQALTKRIVSNLPASSIFDKFKSTSSGSRAGSDTSYGLTSV